MIMCVWVVGQYQPGMNWWGFVGMTLRTGLRPKAHCKADRMLRVGVEYWVPPPLSLGTDGACS